MNASLLPHPLFEYHQLFNLLLPVTSLLVAAGLLSVFQQAATPADQLRGLVKVTAIVALLAYFDVAVQTGKTAVQQMVEKDLKADPVQLPLRFAKELMSDKKVSENESLWSEIWSKITSAGSAMFHALLAAFISLVALVAMVIFFLAYLAQELALEFGIGLSPLLIGFLLLPATRSIGAQFLLYMLAIVLFPLGWGAATLVSDQLIVFATKQDLGSVKDAVDALSFSARNLFGALLLAIWMIISTLFAPFAILRAVTSGVHLGADSLRAVRQIIRH